MIRKKRGKGYWNGHGWKISEFTIFGEQWEVIRRSLGASLAIIGKSLGHKSHQSTAIYSRLSNDPVRASMEAAFDFTRIVKT
ncbi:MAG: hypothetical protein LBI81_03215 [Puniceicoccales bacterium]|nr:hypothetical protein [Puniceicoccales bacterium]